MQTFAGERFDSPKTGTHLVERAADLQWIVHPGGSDEQHGRSSSACARGSRSDRRTAAANAYS
jgi:hypothetical protein